MIHASSVWLLDLTLFFNLTCINMASRLLVGPIFNQTRLTKRFQKPDFSKRFFTSSIEKTTIDPHEVSKFAAIAKDWWDPNGHARLLHKMNMTRVDFLRHTVCKHFGIDTMKPKPFEDMKILDVGCGGGLLSEALARLGGEVTGIDVSNENIAVCRSHAFGPNSPFIEGKNLIFKKIPAEELLKTDSNKYDIVCSMEVIEHVNNPESFVSSLVGLSRPGGSICLSTMNRSPQAYLSTIVAAEHILNWVPVGTHDWSKYIKPEELVALLRRNECYVLDAAGMEFDLAKEVWNLTSDTSVNYIIHASKIEE